MNLSRPLAGVAVLALLVLSPAAASAQDPPPAAPSPAPVEVCNAVTVQGATLIRDETQADTVLVAAGIDVTGDATEIGKARTALGCEGDGPAERTPDQVRADVCAALDVDVLSTVIRNRVTGSDQATAQANLAVGALPPVVGAARTQLHCDAAGAPAADAPPSTDPAPNATADEFDCADFPLADGRTAQAVFDADPTDPNRLDGDNDGAACEAGDPAASPPGTVPTTDAPPAAPPPAEGDSCDGGNGLLGTDGTCIPRVGEGDYSQVGKPDVPVGGVETGGGPATRTRGWHAVTATTSPVPGLNRGESARFQVIDTGRSYIVVGRAHGMQSGASYASLVYPDGGCSKPVGGSTGLTLGGAWQNHGDRNQGLYERYDGDAYRAVKRGGGIGSVSIRAITAATNSGGGNFSLTAEARACAAVSW